MPVTVIVGGQYGSEGKGKVTHFFAKEYKASAVIRVGGPNSGHTVINPNGEALIFKHLSTASILPGVKCILTSGHYIDLEILMSEIKISDIKSENLLIDAYAMIITEEHKQFESENNLTQKIGSTGCGLGGAVIDRISRNQNILFAKDIPELQEYIADTNIEIRKLLSQEERIIIEGTQGFGLSLLHSQVYPYCTSRDTTASGFASEAGISPLDIDDVILVIRAFPIRVAGNSGPLENETDWDTISKRSQSGDSFFELTSVSKKIRRVADFDPEIVMRAISYNRPTKIVLNHVDYFDKTLKGELSDLIEHRICEIESSICRRVDYLGFDRQTIIKRN